MSQTSCSESETRFNRPSRHRLTNRKCYQMLCLLSRTDARSSRPVVVHLHPEFDLVRVHYFQWASKYREAPSDLQITRYSSGPTAISVRMQHSSCLSGIVSGLQLRLEAGTNAMRTERPKTEDKYNALLTHYRLTRKNAVSHRKQSNYQSGTAPRRDNFEIVSSKNVSR